jgi:hypothetical protein
LSGCLAAVKNRAAFTVLWGLASAWGMIGMLVSISHLIFLIQFIRMADEVWTIYWRNACCPGLLSGLPRVAMA